MHPRTSLCLATALSSLGLVHCGSVDDQGEASSERTATATDAIIDGDPVVTDTIGTPELWNMTANCYCSATLLSDRWLITARHCVNANCEIGGSPTQPSEIWLESHSRILATEIYAHPTSDVAILRLERSVLDPNGHPYANPLFMGRSSDLRGSFGNLYCQGWGRNTYDGGSGILRWANIHVSGAEGDGFKMVPTDGNIQWLRDSGGSCYVLINGRYQIAGIQSTSVWNPTKKKILSAHQVGADAIRPWVESIVGNSVAIFAASDFRGAAQELVQGSSYGGLYSTGMLTIGDNTLSSLIVPKSFKATLFRDSKSMETMFEVPVGAGMAGNLAANLQDQMSSASVLGGVQFFADVNFGGASITERHFRSFSIAGTSMDNAISSLTVPSGWTVTLYDYADGSVGPGARATFTEGEYRSIDTALDNRTSYIVIREPAHLTVGAYAEGTTVRMLPGCYDNGQMGLPNDSVSHVYVPMGLSVQLFQNPGLQGNNIIYTTSHPTLGSWNDLTSGVCVYAQPTAWCGALLPGEALFPNTSIWSCDHRFVLEMQSDGNLVLYQRQNDSYTALWSTETWGTTGRIAVMEQGGDFVLYDANNSALWRAGTLGQKNAVLSVQNDGNVVIYQGSTPVWSSNTCCH